MLKTKKKLRKKVKHLKKGDEVTILTGSLKKEKKTFKIKKFCHKIDRNFALLEGIKTKIDVSNLKRKNGKKD